jgi:tetratricopeptide (TPR) repeat protein
MVVLPLAVVVLAIVATANHYRTMQAMDALLIEGERFEATHRYDREYQSFQQALRLAPRQEQPHEEMGTYYLEQKNYDQAIQEFQQAIRLTEGDDDHAQMGLGLAFQLKGDPQKAQQIFEAMLGKSPKNDGDRRSLAVSQMELADLYAKQQLYADAIKAYQRALRLEPNFAEAHNNLAWLYATCDDQKFLDPKAALEHAQRAVVLTAWKDGGVIDTLAEAHFANGDYQQAVEIQKKALALEPDNKELQEHMARYRKAAGI